MQRKNTCPVAKVQSLLCDRGWGYSPFTVDTPSASYYATAFVLGALHSFEPAHGKSVMAAYLIGQRRTVKDAVLLALTITITHTFSVFALAAAAWWFGGSLSEPHAARGLGLISGGLVLVVGLWLLAQRLRGFRRNRVEFHPQPHVHDHSHPHVVTYAHPHEREHQHGHSHAHDEEAARRGLGQLLLVGVSGGLVPCPGGMAMLLTAVGAGQAAHGVGLVTAFSAGVGAVVLALGVLFCKGSALVERLFGKSQQLERWLPMASALIICAVGVYLILKAGTH